MPRTNTSSSTRRRKGAGGGLPGGWIRALLTVVCVLLFAAGIYLGIQLAKPPPPPSLAAIDATEAEGPVAGTEPSTATADPKGPEAPSDDTTPDGTEATAAAPDPPTTPALTVQRQPPTGTGAGVRVAVVIDDLGRSVGQVEQLAALGVPLTYAVLPFEPQTPRVVAALRRRGAEILCHLPMEAKGAANPGPGALRRAMSPEELVRATEAALAAVPGAVGVNNHMGSGIASDREAITAVLEVVQRRSLYFLDSRTSADTLGYSAARQMGVPAAERQVFLDTARDRQAIDAQFDRLLEVALERGGAIAIGHPYAETLEVLRQRIPKAEADGVRFVTVGELLAR